MVVDSREGCIGCADGNLEISSVYASSPIIRLDLGRLAVKHY